MILQANYLKLIFLLSLYIPSLFSEKTPFEELVEVYGEYGGEKYMIQEEITQRAHVLQAAYIAHAAGAPDDFVIALLFHDIGQVAIEQYVGQVDYLHENHDEIGGDWMSVRGFPSHVCDFVRYHTLAKVVLCSMDPTYYDRLSTASKISYKIQKEKFGEEALAAFINHPYAKEFMASRRCDDMSKIVGFNTNKDGGNISRADRPLPDISTYAESVARVLEGEGSQPKHEDWIERIEVMYSFMAANREAFEDLLRTSEQEDVYQQIRGQNIHIR